MLPFEEGKRIGSRNVDGIIFRLPRGMWGLQQY